jgi:hypothetical protein
VAKVNVLLARPADSDGYTHLILADPSASPAPASRSPIDTPDGASSIILHGQREFDVLSSATAVHFPDGTAWKPGKCSVSWSFGTPSPTGCREAAGGTCRPPRRRHSARERLAR